MRCWLTSPIPADAPHAGQIGFVGVQTLDARPQETTHLIPRARHHPAQQRQPQAGVHTPQPAQRRDRRDAELEHPDPAAGLDHAGELAHGARPIIDVAQQVGEREGVELAVGERQPLGLAGDERDPLSQPGHGGQPRARRGQHGLTLVQADDLASALAHELGGDHAGPCRDIEDALAGRRMQAGDQRPAPAGVLSEAEHRAHAVIAGRKAGEEAQRVALARRSRGGGQTRIGHPPGLYRFAVAGHKPERRDPEARGCLFLRGLACTSVRSRMSAVAVAEGVHRARSLGGWCIALAAALLSVGFAWPSAALAHVRTGTIAVDYRASISAPRTAAYTAEIGQSDHSLRLTLAPGHAVIVLGYLGEPMARLDAAGVAINAASPTAVAVGLLAKARAVDGATPSWMLRAAQRSVTWRDARAQQLPAGVRDSSWAVALIVDGHRGALRGQLRRYPAPSLWVWALLLAGLLTAGIRLVALARVDLTRAAALGCAALGAVVCFGARARASPSTPTPLRAPGSRASTRSFSLESGSGCCSAAASRCALGRRSASAW